MRAFNRLSVAIVVASTFASGAGAQTKADEGTQSPTRNSSAASVTTVDQAIDQIIAREHEEIGVIRQYAPGGV